MKRQGIALHDHYEKNKWRITIKWFLLKCILQQWVHGKIQWTMMTADISIIIASKTDSFTCQTQAAIQQLQPGKEKKSAAAWNNDTKQCDNCERNGWEQQSNTSNSAGNQNKLQRKREKKLKIPPQFLKSNNAPGITYEPQYVGNEISESHALWE